MSLVVSHETRRVAAARPRSLDHPKPIEKPFDPDREDVLIELFGAALAHWCPRSIAELGTTANPTKPGFDVSLWYLDEPGNRYIRKCALELHREDLTGQHVDVERVKLVHAPLVFEELIDGELLDDAVALVAPGGAFSVVLEIPVQFEGKVSRGQDPSIHRRRVQWPRVDPIRVREALGKYGFKMTHETKRAMQSGRKLWLGIFAK
jgi:hypothetical protein